MSKDQAGARAAAPAAGREGERSEAERPAAGAAAQPPAPVIVADPEVPEKARRRQFSAQYKLRVVEEADRCSEPGEIGALLRREGLYSSHLSVWRRQREEGSLDRLRPQKRGRKTKPVNPLAKKLAELERENEKLRQRLQQAETIIDVQKKVSQILGTRLSDDPTETRE